jgi:hypothetical protein
MSQLSFLHILSRILEAALILSLGGRGKSWLVLFHSVVEQK